MKIIFFLLTWPEAAPGDHIKLKFLAQKSSSDGIKIGSKFRFNNDNGTLIAKENDFAIEELDNRNIIFTWVDSLGFSQPYQMRLKVMDSNGECHYSASPLAL